MRIHIFNRHDNHIHILVGIKTTEFVVEYLLMILYQCQGKGKYQRQQPRTQLQYCYLKYCKYSSRAIAQPYAPDAIHACIIPVFLNYYCCYALFMFAWMLFHFGSANAWGAASLRLFAPGAQGCQWHTRRHWKHDNKTAGKQKQ